MSTVNDTTHLMVTVRALYGGYNQQGCTIESSETSQVMSGRHCPDRHWHQGQITTDTGSVNTYTQIVRITCVCDKIIKHIGQRLSPIWTMSVCIEYTKYVPHSVIISCIRLNDSLCDYAEKTWLSSLGFGYVCLQRKDYFMTSWGLTKYLEPM